MYSKTNGFTLLESLITATLVIIITLFAIPQFESVFQHSHDEVMVDRLVNAIHLARSEAITHNTTAMLCHSNNQKTCSGGWQDGFIIVLSKKILFSFQQEKRQGLIHSRIFPFYLADLEFLPSGESNFENGTFWYCYKDAKNPSWALIINQMGRLRVVYPNHLGGILDSKNQPLSCAYE